jgi:hypothetical protein
MAILESLGQLLFAVLVGVVILYILYSMPGLVRDRFEDGKRAARDPDEK